MKCNKIEKSYFLFPDVHIQQLKSVEFIIIEIWEIFICV